MNRNNKIISIVLTTLFAMYFSLRAETTAFVYRTNCYNPDKDNFNTIDLTDRDFLNLEPLEQSDNIVIAESTDFYHQTIATILQTSSTPENNIKIKPRSLSYLSIALNTFIKEEKNESLQQQLRELLAIFNINPDFLEFLSQNTCSFKKFKQLIKNKLYKLIETEINIPKKHATIKLNPEIIDKVLEGIKNQSLTNENSKKIGGYLSNKFLSNISNNEFHTFPPEIIAYSGFLRSEIQKNLLLLSINKSTYATFKRLLNISHTYNKSYDLLSITNYYKSLLSSSSPFVLDSQTAYDPLVRKPITALHYYSKSPLSGRYVHVYSICNLPADNVKVYETINGLNPEFNPEELTPEKVAQKELEAAAADFKTAQELLAQKELKHAWIILDHLAALNGDEDQLHEYTHLPYSLLRQIPNIRTQAKKALIDLYRTQDFEMHDEHKAQQLERELQGHVPVCSDSGGPSTLPQQSYSTGTKRVGSTRRILPALPPRPQAHTPQQNAQQAQQDYLKGRMLLKNAEALFTAKKQDEALATIRELLTISDPRIKQMTLELLEKNKPELPERNNKIVSEVIQTFDPLMESTGDLRPQQAIVVQE